jgi:hypothetical protein
MRTKLFILLVFFSGVILAQDRISFDKNRFDSMINEVFVDKTYLHQNSSSYYNHLKNAYSNRMYLKFEKKTDDEKFENIQSIAIYNTYNSEVNVSLDIDIKDFNPFKYQLEFFSRSKKVYRLYDSDYLLVISPIKL